MSIWHIVRIWQLEWWEGLDYLSKFYSTICKMFSKKEWIKKHRPWASMETCPDEHIQARFILLCIAQVQFSRSVVSDSLRLHWLQQVRLPCPSPTPRACSNSCLSSPWFHPTTWSPSPPAFNFSQHQGLFQCQFFASGGQVLQFQFQHQSFQWMNIQKWFPLGLTGLISLQSKRLSRSWSKELFPMQLLKYY